MFLYITMTYSIEHITRALRTARKAQGLNQRTLSFKVGIPQSHISKIENGAVDLRVSSLVELARALNLEIELVPRNSVPVVHAVIQQFGRHAPDIRETNLGIESVRPAYSLDYDDND